MKNTKFAKHIFVMGISLLLAGCVSTKESGTDIITEIPITEDAIADQWLDNSKEVERLKKQYLAGYPAKSIGEVLTGDYEVIEWQFRQDSSKSYLRCEYTYQDKERILIFVEDEYENVNIAEYLIEEEKQGKEEIRKCCNELFGDNEYYENLYNDYIDTNKWLRDFINKESLAFQTEEEYYLGFLMTEKYIGDINGDSIPEMYFRFMDKSSSGPGGNPCITALCSIENNEVIMRFEGYISGGSWGGSYISFVKHNESGKIFIYVDDYQRYGFGVFNETRSYFSCEWSMELEVRCEAFNQDSQEFADLEEPFYKDQQSVIVYHVNSQQCTQEIYQNHIDSYEDVSTEDVFEVESEEIFQEYNDELPQAVNRSIYLHEATYIDYRNYGENPERPDITCSITISNVTNSSFDFEIWQYNWITGSNDIIFKRNTAIFTGDGSTATYFGQQYTLHFSFPEVPEIEVTGFEPTEGIGYWFNGIPGYEFN